MRHGNGRITITWNIAWAAGHDAANRRMRKAGRKVWNRADGHEAARVTNNLLAYIEPLPIVEAMARDGLISKAHLRKVLKARAGE